MLNGILAKSSFQAVFDSSVLDALESLRNLRNILKK
jgi:hypothetical protein